MSETTKTETTNTILIDRIALSDLTNREQEDLETQLPDLDWVGLVNSDGDMSGMTGFPVMKFERCIMWLAARRTYPGPDGQLGSMTYDNFLDVDFRWSDTAPVEAPKGNATAKKKGSA